MAQKRRGWLVFVLVLAVVAAGSWLLVRGRTNAEEAPYRSTAVDRGTIVMSVTATGTVSAVTTVQVGSQVSGVIAALYADFNSPVKKGQLLAELDPTPFAAQVEQRRADLLANRVDLANAERTLARQKRLSDLGIVAEAELDAAQAARDTAEARVDQSEAALRQAETNLHYTKIRSPIDGVVSERQYDIGQTVAASFQAPTLFTIAQDLTKMEVQADVDQSDIGRVEVGQPASFTVDAYPTEVFHGKIAEIRLNATTNQNVVTYPVILRVDNPDLRLRPKMTADVTIEVARAEDALRVPNAALRFRPPENAAIERPQLAGRSEGGGFAGGNGATNAGRSADRRPRGEAGGAGWGSGGGRPDAGSARPAGAMVWVLDGLKLRPVHVQTGISDGRFTAITRGRLEAGQEVVVGTETRRAEETSGMPGFSRMRRRP